MNLIQTICCLLIAKGSEVGQTYLGGKTELIQSTLRARRAATAQDAQRFLDSAITELTLTGSDFCKCDAVAAPTPDGRRQLGGDAGAWYKSWKQRKN
jgi:hypothetical protein